MERDSRDLQVRIRSLIESLTVAKLKSVLRTYKCSVSGRKADLQERMLMLLRNTPPGQLVPMEQVIRRADYDDYNTPAPEPTYTGIVNSIWGSSMPQGRAYPVGGSVGGVGMHISQPQAPKVPPVKVNFNLAPFYQVMDAVSEPAYFPGPQREHRKSIELRVRLSEPIVSQLRSQNLILAFLSCDTTTASAQHTLYYPFNCSIWINGINVPTAPKTRGIKGVPGTATPLDLTRAFLETAPNPIPNPLVKFTFSVSQDAAKDDRTMYKSFTTGTYLLRPVSIPDLIKEVTSRPRIPVSDAIKIIKGGDEGDEEADILATQAVHSLKDPIVRTRMRIPIRSRTCDHLDCVDAEAFVMFLKQSPRWKCAHCNGDITWESMAVDDLMTDILNNTKESADKVSINDDGTWTLLSSDSDSEESSDDDEPPSKRIRPKQPEVISLLSDDDDDEDLPIPPYPPQVQQHQQQHQQQVAPQVQAHVQIQQAEALQAPVQGSPHLQPEGASLAQQQEPTGAQQQAQPSETNRISRIKEISDHESTSDDEFDQPITIPAHIDLCQQKSAARASTHVSGTSLIADLGGSSILSNPVTRSGPGLGPTKGTFSTPPVGSPRSPHVGTQIVSVTEGTANGIRRDSAFVPSRESIRSLFSTESLFAKRKNSHDTASASPPKTHRANEQYQHNRPWEAQGESERQLVPRLNAQQPPQPQTHMQVPVQTQSHQVLHYSPQNVSSVHQEPREGQPHTHVHSHSHSQAQAQAHPNLHPYQAARAHTVHSAPQTCYPQPMNMFPTPPRNVWETFSTKSGAVGSPAGDVVDLTKDD